MRQDYVAVFRRSEKKVGESVCHDPIDFFRHSPVERTQSCFHMSYPNASFGLTSAVATVELTSP